MASPACRQCGRCSVQEMLSGLCPLCLLSAGTKYDYTIVNVLGRSENGTIYVAEQWPTHRLVTVKVLSEASDGEAEVERLQRQRQALAILAHPVAAEYVDVGLTTDRRPYLIRDYLRGTPITVYCRRYQVDRSIRQLFLASVCDMISQSHEHGIVHGSVKPTNIFILTNDREPTIKVVDFGLRPASPADDDFAFSCLTTALL